MKKKAKSAFARNVRARRKALGYKSAKDFAEFARIPYGTLRDIEAGYSDGWRETREAIAGALKTTVDALNAPPTILANKADDHTKQSTLSPGEAQILALLERQSPERVELEALRRQVIELQAKLAAAETFENLASLHPKAPEVMRSRLKDIQHILKFEKWKNEEGTKKIEELLKQPTRVDRGLPASTKSKRR